MVRYLSILFLLTAAGSCRPPVYPPKPQGYFRIDTPAVHEYKLFDRAGFPYTFEYPVYSRIQEDTLYKGEKGDHAYWINIFFPSLAGELNLTYKPITATHTYIDMVQEADAMSFEHSKRADNIEQFLFHFPNHHVSGILYTLYGNAATRYQFTATDSAKNFIRGVLYFNVTPNADSLKPATDFLLTDIRHMMETLQWR
jgi:gliding motility-associated lipoprotein GldD